MTPDKAYLIHRAIGSSLEGLLPGQEHQAAIARRSPTFWDGCQGAGGANKTGITWSADIADLRAGKPDLKLSWREVLEVLHRGGES